MRMTAEQKQAARRGIVEASGRLFRIDGYVGVGVDAIARAMNQTTGAVYAHFAGKLDLFRAVVEAGLARLVHGADRARSAGAPDWPLRFARQYLSPAHRDAIADGCLLPALSPDVARADDDMRRAYARQVREVAARLADGCPNVPPDQAQATGWAVLALCAGGVMLSRATLDEPTANEILASCRAAAERLLSGAADLRGQN
jgi:TetR/AcrR family transcriptional repressor of nem operon